VRNVIVTGGSRGLGLELVKSLVDQGYGVIAVSRQSNSQLDSALKAGSAPGHFFSYDFSDVSGIDELAKQITKSAGPVYGLVNNAAMGLSGMLATEKPANIDTVIGVNLLAPILFTRAILRGMLVNGNGRIVNVSSVNAFTGYSGLAAYAATKAGLVGFTKSLAREVGRSGITVNAVAPGLLETDMTGSMDATKREKIIRRSPLKRFAKVDEVASAISYLLSDAAAGMTGTVMTIDAGNSA
jgi:3-oxoacyl-[acyl-carrier protein] reductase